MNNMQILKAQKTKLLNKQCENEKEFEEIQNQLNLIEAELKMLETRE